MSPSTLVFHMVPRVTWDALPSSSAYHAETLDSEGFVHCTAEPAMLEVVANRYYRNEPGDWLILAVDLEQVRAEVRWEAADEHLFPHIYGPIERCAVVRIVPFPRRHDGTYSLPEDSL